MPATFQDLSEMAEAYGVSLPDDILKERPLLVDERSHLPRDLADPTFLERNAAFYRAVEAVRPGYIVGRYLNPHRRGEPVDLVDRSDRFVSLAFPTRGMKGVSFSFPNMLSWEHSIFANDPKKEQCAGTAWYRKNILGQRIFIVEPLATDGRNARFNPLTEVRVGTVYEVTDAQAIADAICDPDGSGYDGESGTWRKRARTLMTAVILHVLYSDEPEKSLRTVDLYFSDPLTLVGEKYQIMKKTIHDKLGVMGWTINGRPTQVHPVVAMTIHEQAERPEGEGGSVKSEMQSFTEQYRNPVLGDNTAFSDFSMADLTDGPVPSTVYFVVTPDTMRICYSYMRLFLTLLVNRNIGPLNFEINGQVVRPHRWGLGLLLDEYVSTMGKLTTFTNSLSFIAGYNIRPAIILQGHGQLVSAYGNEADNIDGNMHTLIFGATNDNASQEFFSKMMGEMTYAEMQRTPMGKQLHKAGAKLLSPSQIRRIPQDEEVLLRAGEFPIPAKKLAYYREDSAFATRVRRTDFASDRIPPEEQITARQRERLHKEYLEMVVRNSGITLNGPQAPPPSANEAAQKELLANRSSTQELPSADLVAEELYGVPQEQSGESTVTPKNTAVAPAKAAAEPTRDAAPHPAAGGVRVMHNSLEFAKELHDIEQSHRVKDVEDEDAA